MEIAKPLCADIASAKNTPAARATPALAAAAPPLQPDRPAGAAIAAHGRAEYAAHLAALKSDLKPPCQQ